MRRFWYAKYALTLLASTAITFHLLYSGANVKTDTGEISSSIENSSLKVPIDKHNFTKSYLRRKLSEGTGQIIPPKWVVLKGNVTVHQGNEHVPFDISFMSTAENVCRDYDQSKKKLLIFVASSADHFTQRGVIRETWGLKLLQTAYNYRIVYLVGRDDETTQERIDQEGYRYGDLVQINLTESFRNLGRKSVAGLQWSRTFCDEADFVMKTDDDILVHIPNLILALTGNGTTDPLLMCHENRMRKILRKELLDKTELPKSYHKYEVSENELPGRFYPPYCSGMAYVFSRSVRNRLLEASLATPVFFIEDVYLTGFCRHKAGIVIRAHSGITLRPPVQSQQAPCSFKDGRITSQEVTPEELRHLWTELNTQGFFCPQLIGFKTTKERDF